MCESRRQRQDHTTASKMDDLPIQKIQISGPTLASLLHRFSSSPGDFHGLLLGHVTFSLPSSLSDDPTSSSSTIAAAASPILTATITSFLSFPSHFPLPSTTTLTKTQTLLGWFSGRRRTPLRPSLKESSTSRSLSSSTSLSLTSPEAPQPLSLSPSLFLLLTTPLRDQLVHTHEYKAFQYRVSADSFEPRSLDVINIGPSFRSHYESFSPHSPFPFIKCELKGSNAMAEDERSEELENVRLKDQKELDSCAEGFEIGRLSRLMGSEVAAYTGELEDLYGKMLAKLEVLARTVEKSSARVLELENNNMKLRWKVAGLE